MSAITPIAMPRWGLSIKPVLAVWGARDRIIPAAHAQNASEGATVRVYDDAGHTSQMEKANRVNGLLKEPVARAET